MGMTSEEAIEIINHYLDYPKEEVRKSLLVAIDTMRKYQKIVQIMERTIDDGTSMYDTLQEIEEVIEDGKID